MRATTGIVCATLAVLLGTLNPASAMAQSVKGTGVLRAAHGAVDGTNLFVTVAVDAYTDENGDAQGTVAWSGDVPNTLPHPDTGPGGPADPYILDVTDLTVIGNMAIVTGVVIASPAGSGNANGEEITFQFVDNSGSGEPDELYVEGYFYKSFPIDSGNYIVSE